MVTLETHFLEDDIELWNCFIINEKKEILEYDGNGDIGLSEGQEED